MNSKILKKIVVLISVTLISHVFTSSPHTLEAKKTARINCYPEAEKDQREYQQKCLARNCLFDSSATSGMIQCYLPENYGYQINGTVVDMDNGMRMFLKRNQNVLSPFPKPIEHVSIDIHYYTDDIIRIKLYDSNNERYEVWKILQK